MPSSLTEDKDEYLTSDSITGHKQNRKNAENPGLGLNCPDQCYRLQLQPHFNLQTVAVGQLLLNKTKACFNAA